MIRSETGKGWRDEARMKMSLQQEWYTTGYFYRITDTMLAKLKERSSQFVLYFMRFRFLNSHQTP